MKPFALKLMALSVLAGAAMTASAETYVAQMYSVPAGYDWMYGIGAGNGAMMTGYAKVTGGEEHAMYRTANGFKDMHPAGWTSSRITDSWGGTYHVGYGAPAGTIPTNALFWPGGGAPVNLHPGGSILSSVAIGCEGAIQVGFGTSLSPSFSLVNTACMWSQTAASFQLLTSASHSQSEAYGTDGLYQVGKGKLTAGGETHALRWRGPGSVPVDLNPAGSTESVAYSVNGTQSVGYIKGPGTGGVQNAALWTVTGPNTTSFTNLNPAAFSESSVTRVRNGIQVGAGVPVGNPTRKQAILWHGSAGTWTNLHHALPFPYTTWNTAAGDIDAQGNIIGTIESPDGTIRRPMVWIRQDN